MRLALYAVLSLFFVGTVEARQNNQGIGGSSQINGLQDDVCYGGTPSGLGSPTQEICVNGLESLEPTAAGTLAVGTTNYPFAQVNASTINSAGLALNIPLKALTALTIGTTGTAVIQGTSTLTNVAASNIVLKGLVSFFDVTVSTRQTKDNNFGLQAGSTIPANGSYQSLISTGPGVVLQNTPTISTTTIVGGGVGVPVQDGTYMVLTTTSAGTSFVLQSTSALAGSGLKLGASTRTIIQGSTISLIYNAALALWTELNYVK